MYVCYTRRYLRLPSLSLTLVTTTAVANATGKSVCSAAVRYINIGERDTDKCQR